jgi:hypothetical protein
MCEVIPPLPNIPSLPGARLKKAQGQLYVYLYKFCLKYIYTYVIFIQIYLKYI